jgi:RNA polymerase sigma-70 factor, ECF subfamily
MNEASAGAAEATGLTSTAVETAVRRSYGRLVALLASRSRDIAAAEDALGDAFHAALITWPRDGVPASPEAWLMTAARRRLHDGWRHAKVQDEGAETLALVADEFAAEDDGSQAFPDERLKLLFVCAHPAIDAAAHAPLMLQTVLGLDAARIAAAFLVSPATLGQRLVRAKARIRSAGIAFEVPPPALWGERLGAVLEAIYAAYGTAWDDVAGTDPRRRGLAQEALALARTLAQLLPSEPEPLGLLALLAFCQARASARRDAQGDYVALDRQDPALWDRALLAEAEAALLKAAPMRRLGPYQIEAALQSAHTQKLLGAPVAPRAIVALYDGLVALHPSLGARVSRAVALATAEGPQMALAALDETLASQPDTVRAYQPYWAARADLLMRAGRATEAREAYALALGLSEDPAVKRFLIGRMQASG